MAARYPPLSTFSAVPLYELVLIKKKKKKGKEKNENLLGLSDARTSYNPFSWNIRRGGRVQLRLGSSVSDFLIETCLVLKNELSFVTRRKLTRNFHKISARIYLRNLEFRNAFVRRKIIFFLPFVTGSGCIRTLISPGHYPPSLAEKTGEAAKVTPRRGRIWPPIYRKED